MDLTNDELRELFNSKTSYANLSSGDIYMLAGKISKWLKVNGDLDIKMKLPVKTQKAIIINLNKDQSLNNAFIKVSSNYFQEREAISFNTDGFIGFAGWASDENSEPFRSAFFEWVAELPFTKGENK